jgi:CDP-diglyceride synthetase
MNRTRTLRYLLFGLLFALVVIGLILRSYPLLACLAVVAIILGVIGDRIENAPTEPYKQNNEIHHHKD